MRTKTLLLSVALSAIGAASAMAQAVYSVNVVGYINQAMPPGFSLVANQLKASPNNQLNNVIPNAPGDAQIQKFASGNYSTFFFDGAQWVDFDGNPTTETISPGEGFFFFNPNPGPANITFVGEVTTGTGLTVVIPPGFRLFSSIVPQDIDLVPANGFDAVADMEVHTYTGVPPDYYKKLIYDASLPGWLDYDTGVPTMARLLVGQGAFVFNPSAVNHNWVRNFVIP